MSTKLESFLREQLRRNVYDLSAELLQYCTKELQNAMRSFVTQTKQMNFSFLLTGDAFGNFL
jgi:hypothetical protein